MRATFDELAAKEGGISPESVRATLNSMETDDNLTLIMAAEESEVRMIARDKNGRLSEPSEKNGRVDPRIGDPLIPKDRETGYRARLNLQPLTESERILRGRFGQKDDQDSSRMLALMLNMLELCRDGSRMASHLIIHREEDALRKSSPIQLKKE